MRHEVFEGYCVPITDSTPDIFAAEPTRSGTAFDPYLIRARFHGEPILRLDAPPAADGLVEIGLP